MSKILCPSCGSSRVKVINKKETRQLTLGPTYSYLVPSHVCSQCGEEGDFDGIGDSIRLSEMDLARKRLAAILIDEIQEQGISLSAIERAFELPQRTISSKWRHGISASGLALLRLVKSMPWLVSVADAKFSDGVIEQEIKRAIDKGNLALETTLSGSDETRIKITKSERSSDAKVNFDASQMLLRTRT